MSDALSFRRPRASSTASIGVAATRARDVGGFGLGLSIARWAVEAHDGTLTLDERVGRGSTFVIRLPAVVRHRAHA